MKESWRETHQVIDVFNRLTIRIYSTLNVKLCFIVKQNKHLCLYASLKDIYLLSVVEGKN